MCVCMKIYKYFSRLENCLPLLKNILTSLMASYLLAYVEYSIMTWIRMVGVKTEDTNVLRKKCFAEKFIIIRAVSYTHLVV